MKPYKTSAFSYNFVINIIIYPLVKRIDLCYYRDNGENGDFAVTPHLIQYVYITAAGGGTTVKNSRKIIPKYG